MISKANLTYDFRLNLDMVLPFKEKNTQSVYACALI